MVHILSFAKNMPTEWLESSDYVKRFRDLENNKVASRSRVPATPPARVLERLVASSLTWSELTTLAKQAILWDMGYVRTTDDPEDVEQVYTSCDSSGKGASMATIALSNQTFMSSQNNCTVDDCLGPTGKYARQHESSGLFLGKLVKCAVPYLDITTTPNSYASMWAQDGLGKKDVPDIRFYRHLYEEERMQHFLLFGIHTVPTYLTEARWGICPGVDNPGSLIIPCTIYKPSGNITKIVTAPDNVEWCVPEQSSAMTQWLNDMKETKTSNGHLSTSTIVVIAVCAVILVVAIAVLYFLIQRRKRKNADNSNYVNLVNNAPSTTAQQNIIPTTSEILNTFQEDRFLRSKRLKYGSIKCTTLISKGAFGEVWLGTLEEGSKFNDVAQNTRAVAVKKLLASRQSQTHDIECFADEIRLMALFSHPNIVTFIGFAWNTLQNMSCITEYLANGDLSSYLATRRNLEWKIKIQLAHGILKAILYLHQLTPQVIHRDLKGKNVLVSDNISAKLSDFGISRQRILDETMTMGVGTAFWAAPEVLLGLKYDSSVDIYSFGCIMSELDTHAKPYSERKDIAAVKLVQMITGQVGDVPLRPRFTNDSPRWFREVAIACLQANPSSRPSVVSLEQRFAQERLKVFQNDCNLTSSIEF